MTAQEARELSVSNTKTDSISHILDCIHKAASDGAFYIVGAVIPDTPEYAKLQSLGYVISEHRPNGKHIPYTFKISW